jgi:hypothetical protein
LALERIEETVGSMIGGGKNEISEEVPKREEQDAMSPFESIGMARISFGMGGKNRDGIRVAACNWATAL